MVRSIFLGSACVYTPVFLAQRPQCSSGSSPAETDRIQRRRHTHKSRPRRSPICRTRTVGCTKGMSLCRRSQVFHAGTSASTLTMTSRFGMVLIPQFASELKIRDPQYDAFLRLAFIYLPSKCHRTLQVRFARPVASERRISLDHRIWGWRASLRGCSSGSSVSVRVAGVYQLDLATGPDHCCCILGLLRLKPTCWRTCNSAAQT